MSRIAKLSPETWDPELRSMLKTETKSSFELGNMRMLAHIPEAAKAVAHLMMTVKTKRILPERLAELVRLRIAFHNQCRSCMAVRYAGAAADGVDQDLVCSLERPAEAKDLSDADKAAIDYADRFAINHLSIDEGVYDGLRRHFTEAEIVELGLWCAICSGLGRLNATWDMVEDLPSAYQDKSGPIAPWKISETITPNK
ncbi:MAG: carboxymuconolactone decarboxylase family protein [Bryobacteraceae bacterium]|nr:carboxymuconolactone decarboxylase family protein [Bryobacteraceae bacterium]